MQPVLCNIIIELYRFLYFYHCHFKQFFFWRIYFWFVVFKWAFW